MCSGLWQQACGNRPEVAKYKLVVVNPVAICYAQAISDLLGQLVTKSDEVFSLVTRC